ncbi:RcnB family protein [Pseudomonas lalucatii]|uniref:RcnB family protein n=1 Tax=Pseudomonas lalucatii TaxID=1424203 RepID=A0ABS5Q385_9PSED|nr:anti-virulence regulator CigR family protein [Pseudomonas lalucatii]MBS7663216.1 RcnB family protein [Pseudomonas lalucatii]MBS7724893.1 RcnB family protein [Pseudomonas lalucatii]QVM87131.1 RcnB family protein [Pseudomonas lalucatii]
MPRSFPLLLCGALSLALSAQLAVAAPKHDKADKHGGGHDGDIRAQLDGPTIDIGRVRIILGDNRHLLAPAGALPPGIAKNLARGKPLPPGIAKRFDPHLSRQLPHYEGYEWQQIGRDVVLVAIATGIVYEVLRNVLD